MWVGPLQVQVQGLFVGAPYHDVPALVAFLTIWVTTVNFVGFCGGELFYPEI